MKATGILLLAIAATYALQLAGIPTEGMALWPGWSFEPWQPATYALVHASPGHFVANGAVLALAGPRLERAIGSGRFAAVVLVAALAGAGSQLAAIWASQDPSLLAKPIVGASAAVYGLLAARAVTLPRAWGDRAFVGLALALEAAGALLEPRAPVAHAAHVGGMAGALVLCAAWRYTTRTRLRARHSGHSRTGGATSSGTQAPQASGRR